MAEIILTGDALEQLRHLPPESVHTCVTSPPYYENQTGRRNKRDVWTVSTNGFRGAHFAVFPEKLIEPCILAGSPLGGTVLDPFAGSGTTGVVAKRLRRDFIGCEINHDYAQMAADRIAAATP